MSAHNYNELIRHVNHRLECIVYGNEDNEDNEDNVVIECIDCCEVLLDFNKPAEKKTLFRRVPS